MSNFSVFCLISGTICCGHEDLSLFFWTKLFLFIVDYCLKVTRLFSLLGFESRTQDSSFLLCSKILDFLRVDAFMHWYSLNNVGVTNLRCLSTRRASDYMVLILFAAFLKFCCDTMVGGFSAAQLADFL